jgi:cholera toxin transcriptional activator
VANPQKQQGKVRFGPFEADLRTGELRKFGTKLKIQEQPFRILGMLIARPGEMVTREELRQQLWPQDTFVDFDHGLNAAMNKLREALSDSAAQARYIETLPKRGYRFLGTIESEPAVADTAPSASSDIPVKAQVTDELPQVPRPLVRTLFLLAQIMYLAFYLAALYQLSIVRMIAEVLLPGAAQGLMALVIATAMVGIPVRCYLIFATSFDYARLGEKYRRMFPFLLFLDELWALSPFLGAPLLGPGLVLATVAALIYLPFGQRTLVQMGWRAT